MNRNKLLKHPPLHTQVTLTIREEILLQGKPGDKIDSEEKLAEQLGVSVLTVRHALSALVQEGLIERRQGSGTFIADRKKHQHVAICTATITNQPMSSFQMRLFFLLGEKFQRAGYQCRFHAVPLGLDAGWRDFVENIERGLTVGAAFIGMTPEPSPSFPIIKSNVPYIGLGVEGVPSVELDEEQLLRNGIRELLSRGCRRIALMGWSNPLNSKISHEKLRAIMGEFGTSLREEWTRWGVSPSAPGAGWAQFREIWTSHKEKPDGLLVTDDMLLRDVAMAILECGIQVPKQLQIVAHANKGSNIIYPFPISRLEVDLDEWAEAMMNQLITLINHQPVDPRTHYIQGRMIPMERGPESLQPAVPASDGHSEWQTRGIIA